MTVAEKQQLRDDQGNTYDFWVHEIGITYKELAGVYVFARDDGSKWTIIYVGETDNFNRRLNTQIEQHHRIQCIRREKATHIFTLVVNGDQDRLDTEGAIRRLYNPPCNQQ